MNVFYVVCLVPGWQNLTAYFMLLTASLEYITELVVAWL